jgi:hypothetical protein
MVLAVARAGTGLVASTVFIVIHFLLRDAK